MHEVAIMESALEQILEHSRKASASRVLRARFRIGELSGVDTDALALAFEVVTPGTAAEGAMFEVETEPARYRCEQCGDESTIHGHLWKCSRCSSGRLTLVAGRALDLIALDIIVDSQESATGIC